ncbi:MAG: hypothetical protein WC325_07500, partial [Candidatus Bathyarchaeia archaeon]
TLLSGGSWTVTVDDAVWSYETQENATHSSIYFECNNSNTFHVAVNRTGVIPEFGFFAVIPLFMLCVLLVVVFRRKHSL